jgi:hypothetical protein
MRIQGDHRVLLPNSSWACSIWIRPEKCTAFNIQGVPLTEATWMSIDAKATSVTHNIILFYTTEFVTKTAYFRSLSRV